MRTLRLIPQALINNSTVVLFIAVFVVFGLSSPLFFQPDSIINNIIKASAYTGITAVGITFVLLTGGIDLSLGSNMYLSSVVAGLLMRNQDIGVVPALLVAMVVGMLYGALNAFCVVRLKIIPSW
jgi:ribose transport system permease protein